jgi:hypothetical protein
MVALGETASLLFVEPVGRSGATAAVVLVVWVVVAEVDEGVLLEEDDVTQDV